MFLFFFDGVMPLRGAILAPTPGHNTINKLCFSYTLGLFLNHILHPHSYDYFARLEAVLGLPWDHLGPAGGDLGAILGHLGAILGSSSGPDGPSLAALRPSWGHLGRPCGHLRAFRLHLGSSCGRLWPSSGLLGPVW